MHKSDMAISSTGQTSYELARMGVPTIGISVSENQKFNGDYWQKAEYMDYLGHYQNEGTLTQLASHVEEMRSFKDRAQRRRIGQKLIDGQGALRLVGQFVQSQLEYSKSEH